MSSNIENDIRQLKRLAAAQLTATLSDGSSAELEKIYDAQRSHHRRVEAALAKQVAIAEREAREKTRERSERQFQEWLCRADEDERIEFVLRERGEAILTNCAAEYCGLKTPHFLSIYNPLREAEEMAETALKRKKAAADAVVLREKDAPSLVLDPLFAGWAAAMVTFVMVSWMPDPYAAFPVLIAGVGCGYLRKKWRQAAFEKVMAPWRLALRIATTEAEQLELAREKAEADADAQKRAHFDALAQRLAKDNGAGDEPFRSLVIAEIHRESGYRGVRFAPTNVSHDQIEQLVSEARAAVSQFVAANQGPPPLPTA